MVFFEFPLRQRWSCTLVFSHLTHCPVLLWLYLGFLLGQALMLSIFCYWIISQFKFWVRRKLTPFIAQSLFLSAQAVCFSQPVLYPFTLKRLMFQPCKFILGGQTLPILLLFVMPLFIVHTLAHWGLNWCQRQSPSLSHWPQVWWGNWAGQWDQAQGSCRTLQC